METSDLRSDLVALLNSSGVFNSTSSGAARLDAASNAWSSNSFEAVLAQMLLKILDRLEASDPSATSPSGTATTRTAATAQPTWIYPGQTAAQTAGAKTASAATSSTGTPVWVYPTPATGAAAAQQAYAASPATTAPAVAAAAAPSAATAAQALNLVDYPRPPADNGRGMHWIPTVSQSPEAVDRYVGALKAMHIKWVTFLNDGTQIGANDHLVSQLKANGIEPVMRVYTDGLRPIDGDLGALVRHYRDLGVAYFQLYNEPNHSVENAGQAPNVDRYLDLWIPAAKVVTENGGLPGFGALSPGGEFKDTEYLDQALAGLKARGEAGLLDRAWLSIHNYQGDRPVEDVEGFARFKVYADVVQRQLGRQLPMIGTEGGTFTAGPEDEPRRVKLVTDAYRYMANREPYNFAYSYWVVANAAGGGHDGAWETQALFQADGSHSPLVDALTSLDESGR